MEKRLEEFEKFSKIMKEILINKGHDYSASDVDSLNNFRAIAKLLGHTPITPYTVCMIYMLKHVFSLLTFCRKGQQESGESLLGRHIDNANYAFLLSQLIDDHIEYFEINK